MRDAVLQQSMDFLGSLADLVAKNCFGKRGVFRAYRVHQRAKIFQALAIPLSGAIGVREAKAAPAPDAAVKNGKHGGKRFTLRAFKEHFVEIVFCFEHGPGVAGVVRFFYDGKRAIEARDLRFAGLFSEEARGETLEYGANGVDVAGFFHGERADNRTFVGDDGDEAFGFELPKSFADDGAGDAHHGDEFAFDEALAGIEAAGDDGLAEFVEDLAAERGCGLGDSRESGRTA